MIANLKDFKNLIKNNIYSERKKIYKILEDYGHPVYNRIYDYFSRRGKVSSVSFRRYIDVNIMRYRLCYVSNSGRHLDDLAESLNVTIEDIVEFINTYSGYNQYLEEVRQRDKGDSASQ